MNLPNKLTVLRMAMIPVFLVFMLVEQIPHRFLWAAIVFAAASFTDFLDGYIARKYHLVTDFGKFMDPLADKLLVMAAMVCFVQFNWTSSVAVIVILAREFLVTSVRLIAVGHGKVIAADMLGKIKTVLQIIWVLYTMLAMWVQSNGWVDYLWVGGFNIAHMGVVILQGVVVLMTVLSGCNYLWNNRSLLSDTK